MIVSRGRVSSTTVTTMLYLFKLFIISLIFFTPLQLSAHVIPHEIAGIRLGTNVEDYPDFELSNYLKEKVVVDWHGFRKGVISYGICYAPDTIVKLQMKYEDSSKQFFDTLMRRYKEQFGAPTEWKGDSFGIKHIWKWRFKDEDGRAVNMILEHNLQDINANIGNQVKLYYPELLENERLCFIELCEEATDPAKKARKEQLKQTSWELLIPKQ
jgi:hypothetical protein